jgi:hypothetical protein
MYIVSYKRIYNCHTIVYPMNNLLLDALWFEHQTKGENTEHAQ